MLLLPHPPVSPASTYTLEPSATTCCHTIHALSARDEAAALRSPARVLVGAPLHEVCVRLGVVRPALLLEKVLHAQHMAPWQTMRA